jgi:hypothetical protein
MKVLKTAALTAAVLLGGCATEYTWQRADGGPLGRNFAWTAAHCRDRAKDYWEDKAEAMQRCMKRHGYVWAAVAVAPSRYYDEYDEDDDGRYRRRHHHHDRYDDDD